MTELRRVLFVSGSGSGNTLRYRVRHAEEALRSAGVATAAVHFTDPLLLRWVERTDVLALYRTPGTRLVLDAIAKARRELGIPVTFDIDDRVFLPRHAQSIPFLDSMPASGRELFVADISRRALAVPWVDRASGTTGPVTDDLATLTSAPVEVLPNGVSREGRRRAQRARRRDADGRVRLGYFSGSATHDSDWAALQPSVVALLDRDPRVDLWLVGPLGTDRELDRFAERVTRVPPVPWAELPDLLASVDVCLAPLDATDFTEGKSAIKWLEAAVVGTPTIATATRPFLDAVVDGETGILVAPGAAWDEPLERLVRDDAFRSALGDRAEAAAWATYSPEQQSERYHGFFSRTLTEPRADVDLSALDELRASLSRRWTLGIDLEPYPFDADMAKVTLAAAAGARPVAAVRGWSARSIRTVRRYSRGVAVRARTAVSRGGGPSNRVNASESDSSPDAA